MTLKNNRAPLQSYFKLCASFHSHLWIQTGVTVPKRPIWVKFWWFFEQYDLAIWRMTLKNDRTPLLCYYKLCVSFRSHWWIQTLVTVHKHLILVKIDDFFSHVTLQVHIWPLLCYFKICVSFCSHWWIQTGVRVWNRPIWIKFDYFVSHATLKFDGWPCIQ